MAAERNRSIPAVPPDVLRNSPKGWGREFFPDDRALPEPRLIAFRYWPDGDCQALYQTVENQRTGGRGFIVDGKGFRGEHSLEAILSRSHGWPWTFVASANSLSALSR